MTKHARWIAALCLLLVGAGVASGAVGATVDSSVTEAHPPLERTPLSDAVGQQSPGDEPDNATGENQTDHHRNPENVSEDGSRADVKRWLVGSMAGRLEGSAINLSQGEYELARSVLGDGFGNDLDRYVNVAGETDTQDDDRTAETFNETERTQQRYAEQHNEFERLYEEYQAALEAGDTERARQLAKRLERLASQINETGQTLVERYETLSNETGVSLEDGRQAILNTTNRTLAQAERVVEQTLVRTELRITSVSPTASYDEPLVVEGRYVTENGTGIAGSEIALDVPGPASTVSTSADGQFRLSHRPIDLETGIRTLPLSATPDNASVYLPATTTISTDVDAVEPSVSITDGFDRIAYGDERTVAVNVTAADRPAGGVPVSISVDGHVLATGRTTESGTLQATVQLPATVRNGSRDLTARVGRDGRAIAEATATSTVVVEATPTALSVVTTNGSAIRVRGELTTAEGAPVAGQPLQLRVDGTLLETLETNASGIVTTSLDGTTTPVGEGVVVTAVYDEPTSNLGPSRASAAAMRLATEENGAGGSEGANGAGGSEGANGAGGSETPTLWDRLASPLVVGAVAIVGVVGLTGGYVWRRRSRPRQPGEEGRETTQAEPTREDHSPEPGSPSWADIEATLEQDGPDAAAVALYEGVLRYVPGETRPEQTPRERYQAVRDALSTEQERAFERVTDLYEQAQFAPERVPTAVIEDVMSAVQQGFFDDSTHGDD